MSLSFVRLWLVAATLLLTVSKSFADVPAGWVDKTLSPYFFVSGGDSGAGVLPLESTAAEVAISGVMADVSVTQVYRNVGDKPLNAEYVFPASTRAAVHGLTMSIGAQVIEARIHERERAKRTFENAKQSGRSASLLEQQRPNVFTMSVANVMPGDRIEVTLRYTELLVPTRGTYEFVYPTVVGPRYAGASAAPRVLDRFVASAYTPEGTPPLASFSLRGTLSAGMPLQALESPSHRIAQERENAKFARFELDPGEKAGQARDFVLRYRLAGSAIHSGLTLYEQGTDKFFLLLVEPPARVTPAELPPREVVFVVDVSGSMHGFPLDTAKGLVSELTRSLRPADKFNLLLFAGSASVLSPHSLAATPENVQAALSLLSQASGAGSTELLPALERALALTPAAGLSRSIVIVTDGYIVADKQAMNLVRGRLGEASVFSFGIGSSVNRYLIEGLAKAGLGEPFVVTRPEDAQAAAARFEEYVSAPVLTDVALAFEGFDAYDLEPRAIPDVFAERPVVVRGKWRGAPRGAITVSGVGGKGAYRQRFDVALEPPRAEHRALARLWARGRIESLSDFGFGEVSADAKREVTALGLRYNLLTEYTSFVAVAQGVRNRQGGAVDTSVPLPLPAGVSNSAVGGGIQGAAEPELWLLLAPLALLLLWQLVRRRQGVACS